MDDAPDDLLLPRGRARRRQGRSSDLLFLVESWEDSDDGVLGFLEGTGVFGDLSSTELRDLLPHLVARHLQAGEQLLGPGDTVDALHVVGHGRLAVESADGRRREAGPGSVVGEAALLGPLPTTDRVTAVRDTVVLRLPTRAFTSFAMRHPEALLGVCRDLVAPSTGPAPHPDGAPGQRCVTVAVVPLGGVAVHPLLDALAPALARYGPSTVIDADAVDRRFHPGASRTPIDDPRNGALVGWLHALEARHRVVFTVTRTDDPDWTRRCLRQADRVLLVGDASRPPEVEEATRAHLGHVPPVCRVDLVLLQPSSATSPSGTAAWLDAVDVSLHHHVRLGRPGDVRRVARHLVDQARGLVLGGGGARGFAHLGVLQAIDELGIEVDVIAGTSIGSVMGALFASGLDHDGRVAAATRALVDRGRLAPVTLPLVSFSSGRRVTRLLQDEPAFAGDVEDLWRPFACVAASLDRVEKVVIDRGPTWHALRASVSLPGVWPPVHHDGELLVDGGILDNLPFEDVVGRVGGGPVIAVDLDASARREPSDPYEIHLSGWRLLARRCNPFRPSPRIPGILEVIVRSATLAGTTAQRQRLAATPVAVHLRPPLGAAGLLDFSGATDLIAPAHAHALEVLAELHGA